MLYVTILLNIQSYYACRAYQSAIEPISILTFREAVFIFPSSHFPKPIQYPDNNECFKRLSLQGKKYGGGSHHGLHTKQKARSSTHGLKENSRRLQTLGSLPHSALISIICYMAPSVWYKVYCPVLVACNRQLRPYSTPVQPPKSME